LYSDGCVLQARRNRKCVASFIWLADCIHFEELLPINHAAYLCTPAGIIPGAEKLVCITIVGSAEYRTR
jgi:hypothetical protein